MGKIRLEYLRSLLQRSYDLTAATNELFRSIGTEERNLVALESELDAAIIGVKNKICEAGGMIEINLGPRSSEEIGEGKN